MTRKYLPFLVCIFFTGCGTQKNLQVEKLTEKFDDNLLQNWTIETHTFENNLAHFLADQVKLTKGKLVLSLVKTKFENKAYVGAELRTKGQFLYGKFEARMKATNALGCIAAFFLYRPSAGRNHEIDTEISGKSPNILTTNHWVDRYSHDKDFNLGFDSAKDFHYYTINWSPKKITWEVDGKLIYETTSFIPKKPMNVIFNLWATNSVTWGGDIKKANLPAQFEIDSFNFTPYKK